MLGLNRNQWLAIGGVILSTLMVSTAQLTDIFGPGVAKTVVSFCAILNGICNGVLAAITGQSGIVQDVQNMPGVERIQVNKQANPTLARMALDPANEKVEPLVKDTATITETATNGGT